MGDQTKEPKSSGPHDSHANAELSKGTSSTESTILRPARALKSELPLRPSYQGRDRYPAHKRGRVCLPLRALMGIRPAC